MYGIMSGLEPRKYADGDLVQKALDLGVTPFGMSDEEIMQAISQKQQVDKISAGGDQGVNFTDQQFKDNFFDYTDPLEYATLPLVSLRAAKLAGKAGKGIYNTVRGPADQFGGKISQNLRGIGAYIGVDELARRGIPEIGIPGYKNPFGEEAKQARQDAQDEAAEDLKFMTGKLEGEDFVDFELNAEGKKQKGISLIDPDEPMETGMSSEDIAKEIGDKKTPLDAMKGIKAFAEFASQLGATPGETEEMTGGQFFGNNTFKPPGVMRMADGGIAVPGFKKGIAAFIKDKAKETLKNRRKKKADKAEAKKKTDTKEETGVTKDAPKGPSALDFVDPYSAAAIRGSAKMATDLASATTKNIKPIAGAIGTYGTLGGIGYGLGSALLGDDKPPVIPPPVIADGAGDMDVLDGESLKDIHYSRSMARAQEAGRDKPTFVDYVASFPGSYTDKLGKDPEFAKQMMAGFVAMMTPSEGIVERSGVADFAGGVLKEQARQEGEVPDQIKLMQLVKENPEILKAMRQLSTASTPADPVADAQAAKAVEDQVLNILYDNKPKKGDKVYDLIGNPIDKNILLQIYRDTNGDYSEIIKQVTKK